MADSQKLFEALVQENAHSLAIFLHSVVQDPGTVDDLFQETLITAWKILDRFDQRRSFGRWLRGIARKLILAHRRKSPHQVLVSDAQALDLIDAHCESVQELRNDLQDERLTHLRTCIDALPNTYRRAVQLRYQDDVRGTKLAEMLETTWDNTKKRLQRGRKMLFECMQQKWATATT
ncbi:MAG: sigma-70 family RNA polymerase sigma factor [Planctomycetota bacterium]|jgi:RNA polymerase sigma-70 factor (ECF subfamily)